MSSIKDPFTTPLMDFIEASDDRQKWNNKYYEWKKKSDSDFSDMPAHLCCVHHIKMKWDKLPRKLRHLMAVSYPDGAHNKDWHLDREGEEAADWVEDRFDCELREIIEQSHISFAQLHGLEYLYE